MYLLFDVGGTNMRIALSSDKKTFLEPRIFGTPKEFKKGLGIFEKFLADLGNPKITGVCGGVPGSFDKAKSTIIGAAPNLSSWVGVPIKSELEKLSKAPVYLENDAALGALGEATVGAGKGKSIVAYLTIGTGVGGARIVNGKIDANALGFEPGHQFICFESGRDLESYISGIAIEKNYGKSPAEITDPKLWEDIARWLAYGLVNTAVHWSPEIIILGGSVMKMMPIERVRFHFKNLLLKIFENPPEVALSKLGDQVGLYGALVLLKQKLSSNT